jgi:uncharacterized protein YndB with AHSA1/START domain
MEKRGFILIADITGYTAYLNESELEHAQGTLTDLLELLIEHTTSPLVISRLEGDAVISYGLEADFASGQAFVETIEKTYIDFRRAIELMVLNNTCECNACANVSSLDLKFFVHFGSFVLQKIADHNELLGTDVNLLHRLLKNSVTADTGIRAYLLCTDAAVEALGIDPTAAMVHHTESVADLGEASMWIMDMQPVYEANKTDARIELAPDEVIGTIAVDIALAPHVVWEYLADPEFRKLLVGSDRQEVTDLKAGRIATGSSYQCFHGGNVYPQVVLEWRPFERMVVEQALELPGGQATMVVDYQLTPTSDGTNVTSTVGRLTGSVLRRVLWKSLIRLSGFRAQQRLRRFRDRIEADHQSRQPADASPTIDLDSITESAGKAVAGWSAAPQGDKPV